MTAGQIDYDEYARKRPAFHCSFRYPSLYSSALARAQGTYVDVGAGDGQKLAHSIERGDLARFPRIVAYDISAERVNRIKALAPSAEAVVASAEALPLADKSVDFYFSDQVIEHVADDRLMAKEIYRVLKPGGYALVGSTIKGKGAWYFYRCNGKWVIDPTHIREYSSIDEYRMVFESVGLITVETAIEPTLYSIGDLLLRLAALTRLVKPERLHSQTGAKLVHWLAGRHVRIPRYWLCYALVTRPQ